jgi:proline iminopeptidase
MAHRTIQIFVLTATLLATSVTLFAQNVGRDLASYATRHEWWVMNPDGCSLYVAEFGHGPPVVVIHGGFGAEHSYMVDAVDGLSSRYHFVLYDQRGSLRSPYKVYERGASESCQDSLITVGNHVAELDRLRQQLGVERMSIVVHSMGAFLALSYLERFPQRVATLVLLAPGVPLRPVRDSQLVAEQKRAANALFENPQIDVEKRKAGVDHPPLSDRQQTDEWRIRYASGNIYDVSRWRQLRGGMAFYNPRAGSDAYKSLPATYGFVDLLRTRSCPTSIILGDHDVGDMGARVIRSQLAGVANVELTVLPNAGHVLWIDQPDLFKAALEQALTRCR